MHYDGFHNIFFLFEFIDSITVVFSFMPPYRFNNRTLIAEQVSFPKPFRRRQFLSCRNTLRLRPVRRRCAYRPTLPKEYQVMSSRRSVLLSSLGTSRNQISLL